MATAASADSHSQTSTQEMLLRAAIHRIEQGPDISLGPAATSPRHKPRCWAHGLTFPGKETEGPAKVEDTATVHVHVELVVLQRTFRAVVLQGDRQG